MGNTSFYGNYWRHAGDSKPDHDPLTPGRAAHINALLADLPGAKVVDAGCGAGVLTQHYAGNAGEVVGLELSEAAVETATASLDLPNTRFEQADLEATWPLPDGWADLVVSSEVIEHVFDFPAYLRECARVTRPGGLLYLTTPYHGLVKNLVLAVRGFDKHYCDYEGGHIRFFTNAHLERRVTDVGYSAVRFKHLGRIAPLAKSTVLIATRRG